MSYIGQNGYVFRTPNVYEHRALVEELIGFKLTSKQIVHHIDENPLNNHPSNLIVCENQKYHLLLHARQDAINRGQNIKLQGHCGRCGLVKDKNQFSKNKRMVFGIHNICSKCQSTYKKEKGLNSRINRPNKWKDRLSQQYRRIKTNYKKREISWLIN